MAGYETLVEAGYAPEMAYFECCHEVKLIVDLIYEGGIANMRYSVSNTAEYGRLRVRPARHHAGTKARMKDILTDIQTGRFVRDFMSENMSGQASFKASPPLAAEHGVEVVGEKLRAMMPWIAENQLVDQDQELSAFTTPKDKGPLPEGAALFCSWQHPFRKERWLGS